MSGQEQLGGTNQSASFGQVHRCGAATECGRAAITHLDKDDGIAIESASIKLTSITPASIKPASIKHDQIQFANTEAGVGGDGLQAGADQMLARRCFGGVAAGLAVNRHRRLAPHARR